ncbi:MAG TPA: DUF3786 domain-containing protein [Anaerolineales bacterium]|nr:DUF3786 domain-containing protein [Anaerolineales bacterium]
MAAKPKLHREPNIDLLADRIADLRSVLQQENPVHLAQRTGAQYHQTSEGKGEFRLSWWEQELILSFPEFEVKQASSGESLLTYQQAMLLYYFTTSDGTPPAGKWISFSELPDGRFYHTAFQGYTGKAVAQAYGNDLVAFRRAAERQGGLSRAFGDAAYAFQAMPRVSLLVVYWQGDEDFTPVCQILFDAAASHHLPTDACAVLGNSLAKILIKKSSLTISGNQE